jgi:DtxR family Mn-dependent transcriptional regulator
VTVVVDRISEQLQPDAATMRRLTDAGLRPGRTVSLTRTAGGIEVRHPGAAEPGDDPVVCLDARVSDHVFVRPA